MGAQGRNGFRASQSPAIYSYQSRGAPEFTAAEGQNKIMTNPVTKNRFGMLEFNAALCAIGKRQKQHYVQQAKVGSSPGVCRWMNRQNVI